MFLSSIFKQLLLRNCGVDSVEICNVYVCKTTIKAAKRIFNSDKICRSYSDLNIGVTFLEHSVFFTKVNALLSSTGNHLFLYVEVVKMHRSQRETGN